MCHYQICLQVMLSSITYEKKKKKNEANEKLIRNKAMLGFSFYIQEMENFKRKKILMLCVDELGK